MLFRIVRPYFDRVRMSIGDAVSAVHSLLTRHRRSLLALCPEAQELLESYKERYVREMTARDDPQEPDPPAYIELPLPLTRSEGKTAIETETYTRIRASYIPRVTHRGQTEVKARAEAVTQAVCLLL